MLTLPHSQNWHRGPQNELHHAALCGSNERTADLLRRGNIDVNQGDPHGITPLMIAACNGFCRVVTILLNSGANLAMTADDGATALHASAQAGQTEMTKMLVRAGSSIEAKDYKGFTPLHVAASEGRVDVMRALIKAGANVDCRMLDGATALYSAAIKGFVKAVRVLLRAKANPLLTRGVPPGDAFVPLDAASQNGYPEVVHELLQRVGIGGCGGASGGVDALHVAAQFGHIHVLTLLTRAGVVDPGRALVAAAGEGREASVKFLLENQTSSRGGVAYANLRGRHGETPLFSCIDVGLDRVCWPRIARLLLDAGADPTLHDRVTNDEGELLFDNTPVFFTTNVLRGKLVEGKPATRQQLNMLLAAHRLLLRVEAVRAESWLWRKDSRCRAGSAEEDKTSTKSASTTRAQPGVVVPILDRRAGRRGAVSAALLRFAGKP
ncbi:unnamed protein product [Scytosiphon promiscuus]